MINDYRQRETNISSSFTSPIHHTSLLTTRSSGPQILAVRCQALADPGIWNGGSGLLLPSPPSVHPHLEGKTPKTESSGAEIPGTKHPRVWSISSRGELSRGKMSWGESVHGAKRPGGETKLIF